MPNTAGHLPPTANSEATRLFLGPSDLARRTNGVSASSFYRALRGQRVSLRVQRSVFVALRDAAEELGLEPPTEIRFGWAAESERADEAAQ